MAVFLLIFFVLMAAYGVLIAYYHRHWNRLPLYRSGKAGDDPDSDASKATEPVKVTVVIAMRNESAQVPALMDCLRAQRYPPGAFEVMVVDDHSEDSTPALLQEASRSFACLRIAELRNGVTGKKKAIETGIQLATGELILATDADCRMGPDWVSTIVSCYVNTESVFIAAPVAMEKSRTVCGLFQSMDFLVMQGITAASVHASFHMMCNGANLAYPRSVFDAVGGFDGIDDIPSGDDMLLMHKVYTRFPAQVVYLKSPAAIVYTAPEKSWMDFWRQRIRWASKGVHYRDKRIKAVLLLTYLVNAAFVILMAISVISPRWAGFLLLFFLAKLLLEFPFVNAVAAFFDRKKLMWYFPLFQPLHMLYIVVAGWLGTFGSYRWKGRKVVPGRRMEPRNL